MKIVHDTLLLIADGEKALFLRNEGDEKYLQLVVEKKREQDNPPTREQGTHRPGRMSDGQGPHSSAVQDTDWHELAKERFASDLADILYKRAHKGEFDRLVLVASPSTLGEIRPHLHQEVTGKIIGEIDKDLTNHPIDQIEKLLSVDA